MVTTITLNPAIDRTILLDQLSVGAVNRAITAREDMGGKGINVSKLLHRMGICTQTTGFIGKHNIKQVNGLLDLEKLDYHFVEIDAATRTNIKIVELKAGNTTDVNESGFTVDAHHFEALKHYIVAAADRSNFMVFSGSLPKGLPVETYKLLIDQVSKKTRSILDVDAPFLVEGIKASPFLIKPNIHELEAAFDVTLKTDQEVIKFCKRLIAQYGVKMVLVSMGSDGSLLITEDECLKAYPVKVDVKSTVGAGDSMLAGMVYGLEHQLTNAQSLTYAAACGTLAVTKEGTESFSKEEIDEMYKRIQVIQV